MSYVIARELMNGMDETHFAPEGNLTRGQLVTTLYRLAGEPEVAEPATFSDVKALHPAQAPASGNWSHTGTGRWPPALG